MFGPLKIIKMKNIVWRLAFSDNLNLGVVLEKCAYVFDRNGNLLNKICVGDYMRDVSYCCGKFGFVNDDGYVYITDENGNLVKKIHVGKDYVKAITMVKDGFVVCWKRCAFFSFNGNKLWDLEIGDVSKRPSYYKGYWYVTSKWCDDNNNWQDKLFIVKDGNVVNDISYYDWVYDTAVCEKYLAVTTNFYLYLYDLSDPANPRKLWRVEGFDGALQVVFSPDCGYIAVTDARNHKLKIYNVKGDLIFEKEYYDNVISVAWKNGRMAVDVGTDLIIYFISPFHCFI